MSANKPAANQEIKRDLLVLTNLQTCTQCISERSFCICEIALCVVGNKLVLVSVWQGVYLQAFGELMKEFPCCPTAKKNESAGRQGQGRQREAQPLQEVCVKNMHYTTTGNVLLFHGWKAQGYRAWGNVPQPRALSALCNLSAEDHPHRSPGDRETQHLGESAGSVRVLSESLPCKGKAPLSPSLL